MLLDPSLELVDEIYMAPGVPLMEFSNCVVTVASTVWAFAPI